MHIVLHPGQFLGAIAAKKDLVEYNPELSSVTVSEFESSLLTCRAVGPTEVELFAIKRSLGFATIPMSRAEEIAQLFYPLRECIAIRSSVLATGMTDLNAIVHPT